VGNTVSHAHNTSKRRWLPNLQKIKFQDGNKVRSGYVCTSCIRSGKLTKVV
jgi:large subunit ribosomal protein L28